MMVTRQEKIRWSIGSFILCLALVCLIFPVSINAADKATIKVGVLGPIKFLTGQHLWWGAQLAADEINNAGGVDVKGVKHKIALVKADTNEYQSVPDAINAAEKLISIRKVDILLGGQRSEAVLAIQEIMADNRIIFMNCGSSHPLQCARVAKDYDRYKYFFRGAHINSPDMGKVNFASIGMVAGTVRRQLGIKKPRVAAIVEKAKWSEPIVAMLPKMFPKMGLEYIGVWQPSHMAIDATAELSAIKSAKAHMIVTFINGPAGIAVSRQWGELKVPSALVGINVESMKQGQWKATHGMCNYEATIDWYGRVKMTDRTIPFYDKFVKRFGEFPIFIANAYDGLYILKEAIERAGTLDSDALVVELEKTDYTGAIGRIVFRPKGDPLPHDSMWGPGYFTALGKQWRDGKLLVVWPDGRAALGDKRWEKIRYEGTVDYVLPPWMLEYWKGKK